MTNGETSPPVGQTRPVASSNNRMTRGRSGALVLSLGFRHSFVLRHWSFVILFVFLASALAEPPPSAQEILSLVRMRQAQQQIDLNGQLRAKDVVIPFQLTQTGPLIRYSFQDPEEVLQLQLQENGSRLELVSDTATEKVSGSKFDEKIRGTGVTYGDLALRFLYWPDGKVLGDETVHARSCWKVQLRAPSRDSQYSNVLLWVDKDSGALMRMEGYDWTGKIAKRFEVVSAQKIDNRWFLKQMRVEEFRPGTNKVQARTYLEIKK